MDLRKPKAVKNEKMGVIPGALSDGVMYNMAVVATDHLVQFAMTKGKDINCVTAMMKGELADFLTMFYKSYKNSGEDVVSIRDGLYKFFQNENGMDIINDRAFYYCNLAFDKCLSHKQKLHLLDRVYTSTRTGNYIIGQEMGFSPATQRGSPVPTQTTKVVTPYSFTGIKMIKPTKQTRIQFESLKKLYLSEALNGDCPEYIQNKVYFDVNLHIINRGKDCLRSMVKTDFDITTDEDGRRYVWLKYSEKFSIREVGTVPGDERTVVYGNQLGDRMYERLGDPRCPVTSFLRYVTHLHPMTDAFWQRPKRQVNKSDYVWYDNTALGNSSLGKFMQKICLQAGLKDSYTNSSIKPIYISSVESICREANGSPVPQPVMQVIPEPTIKLERLDDEDAMMENDDVSSSDSEYTCKSEMNDKNGNQGEQELGLREAKMEVLNSLQKLMVKDIQKFVDWLKTVRVMKNAGELMVLCSPVDRATVESDQDVPGSEVENKEDNSTGNGVISQNGDKSNGIAKNVHEASMNSDTLENLHGISIKQVDFLTLDSTHCSCKELLPLKITIPTSDSLLLSGITDDTQLLLHRKCGPIIGSEKMKDRVFYSENNMDVAEVAAILGTRKKVSRIHTSSDFQSNLPPRKRMTDPMFNMNVPSAKKLCNITNIDDDAESDLKLETNLNCLKPATLKSLPIRHKKKVRFSSGIQAFKLKTEPIDT